MNYKCPHCNGYINIRESLIFSTRTPDGRRGLISLHAEIGDYTVKSNPEYQFAEGEQLDFFCPVCNLPLSSEIHDKLARIIMLDEDGKRFDVLFSKIAGEKSTYKIVGQNMEIFGDDSAEYIDYINLSLNL